MLSTLIKDEKKLDNDKTFASSLGLNMYQEQHKMIADIDVVA